MFVTAPVLRRDEPLGRPCRSGFWAGAGSQLRAVAFDIADAMLGERRGQAALEFAQGLEGLEQGYGLKS